MTTTRPRVVLGVGHEPVDSALEYAVAQAQRLGAALHVVHVERIVAGGPDAMVLSQLDIERLGRENVDAVVARAKELAPELEIEVGLHMGAIVPTIVDRAEGAEMVVLEHRSLPRWERFLTRSVAGGVTARTSTPSVTIPEGWRPQEGPGVVTVGVDVAERSGPVVRAAAQHAAATGARLRVVHAWDLPATYDGMVTPEEGERWAERSAAEMREAMTGIDELAGLDVEVLVRQGAPADELLTLAEDSALVVLGRHDPLIPIGSHLGPVVRNVLKQAPCPVLVVDPRE